MGRKSRRIAMKARIDAGELKQLAQDDDGNPVYEHPEGQKFGLVLYDGTMVGAGRPDEYGSPGDMAIRSAQNAAMAERRRQKVEQYEAEITESLDSISHLQRKLVDAGSSDIEMSSADVQKFKLALTASENILNRIMGRPKQTSEVKIEGSVIDEMAQIVDEWVIEDVEVEDE